MEEKKGEENFRKNVEVLLFASADEISIDKIKETCREKDAKKIKVCLDEIKKDYDSRDSPIELIEGKNGFRLSIRAPYVDIVRKIVSFTDITKPAMETLSIIAWKNPAMQADVVKIRSASAYEHIRELAEKGFIEKNKSGRSYTLKLAEKFYKYFNIPQNANTSKIFSPESAKQEDSSKEIVQFYKKVEEDVEKTL